MLSHFAFNEVMKNTTRQPERNKAKKKQSTSPREKFQLLGIRKKKIITAHALLRAPDFRARRPLRIGAAAMVINRHVGMSPKGLAIELPLGAKPPV